MDNAEDKNWIEHDGVKVLYRDYRNLQGEALIAKVREYNQHTQSLKQTDLLMVIDVTDAYVDREGLAAFKQVAAANREKVRKTAVVGLEGVKKFFLDVVVRFSSATIRSFDSVDESLVWLFNKD